MRVPYVLFESVPLRMTVQRYQRHHELAMFRHTLTSLAKGFESLLFPPSCGFCDTSEADDSLFLCTSCRESLKKIPQEICGQCGRSFPGVTSQPEGRCLSCLVRPKSYHRARYGVSYHGILREALLRFKFYGALYLGRPLSAILIEAFHKYFQISEFDLIVAVPMHRRRLVERGYNQALILAERLAQSTGIPLDRTCLNKIKDTKPQVGLSRAERITNIRNSFEVESPERIANKRVLVIDDVATTGTTIEEVSNILRITGTQRVDALVLALRDQKLETSERISPLLPSDSL